MNNANNKPPQPVQFGAIEERRTPQYKGVATQSLYVTMRDGVRIAIDIILPKDLPADAKLPAVLVMARYWRSFELRTPWPRAKAPLGPRPPIADFLASHGYAVVAVDARGTGASFGSWPYVFSRDEIEDYGEVVAWITNQPWSNGTVGAIGFSYEGTTAQLLAAAHPTAVEAVIPQQMEFDVYTDAAFPGGIFNDWFTKIWRDSNHDLDRNRVPKDWGWSARLFIRGVRPVDTDKKRNQLKQAVAAHSSNPDIYQAVKDITYRDDPYSTLGVTLDAMSVFSYKDEIERSGAAIFGWGSWLDAATADTVLRRFVSFSNPQRAVIGAWNHKGEKHGSPYCPPKAPPVPSLEAQWQESLRFLNHHLKGIGDESISDKILFYFTLGEEKWKTTAIWPPAGTTTQRWYLAKDGMLSQETPAARSGADTYTVDFEASTGATNRWHTEDGVTPVVYKDRAKMDRRLLTYTSPPLTADTEITGYPVVTLYVTSTASDGAFFVYLEDVDETGEVIYVTEGQLRALHRKVSTEAPPYKILVPYHSFKKKDAMPLVPGEVAELTFGLLPTSVLIKKGHRLRVAIAGHDKETFARIPAEGRPVITVARNREHASFVELPTIQRLT